MLVMNDNVPGIWVDTFKQVVYQINNHTETADLRDVLLDIYDRLHAHYGYEAHWWPIFTPNWRWEIMLGSILVQQTQWERVEQAIKALDALGLVDERAMAAASVDVVIEAIRPVAYFNAKGRALIALAQHIVEHYGGETAALFEQPAVSARVELLRLANIGPETAELYAAVCRPPAGVRRRCLLTTSIRPAGYDSRRSRRCATRHSVHCLSRPCRKTST